MSWIHSSRIYLPFSQNSGIFGWDVKMEKLILSPRTEIFSGKRDFLKGRPKFPNGISDLENVRYICWFLLVPGPLSWTVVEKNRGNGMSASH